MSLPSRSLAPASGSTTSLSDSSARRRFAKLSRRASTAPRASTETQNETSTSGRLIVYTKPGCCLCDGLSAKLETVLERSRAGETSARTGATWDSLKDFTLEHRDVSTRDSWAQEYAGSVPRVFFIDGASEEVEFPRPAPKTPPERVGDDLDALVRRHRGGAPPTRPKTSSSSSWSVNTNAPDSGGVTF